jgi:tetratricopeptide (TPR) repeat protein
METQSGFTVARGTVPVFVSTKMGRSPLKLPPLILCIGVACLCLSVSPLVGVERSKDFVDGLRAPERGFHDVALDYLEAMRTSPLADKAFRETIDYEVGVTLLEASRLLPTAEREKELDKARRFLRKFLLEHPQHPLETAANRQLAHVLIERGNIKKELTGQPDRTSTERQSLVHEARSLFEEARKSLSVVDAQLNRTQKAFGKLDPSDMAGSAERNRVRSEIILTRFALAKMLYEIAHTYNPDSKEFQETLSEAASMFGQCYWKYERWMGSYAFRLEEARCYKELGDCAKALAILDELSTSRSYDEEAHRRVRTAATSLALQTYSVPRQKRSREAWNAYERWENNVEQPGEADKDTAAVKYFAAQAALELARTIDKRDAGQVKQRAEYVRRAKALLSFVANFPGEYALKARLALADPLLTVGEIRVETPKDFGNARERAKLAWDKLQQGDLTAEQERPLQAEARVCFRFALDHAPDDVKIDDLNVIRYCLAYLDWAAEDYHEAAVLGEFLAKRYPKSPEAQRGAEIALKAYARLCADASPRDDRKFEADQMTAMANYITDRWPRSPVADEAWMMLVRAAMARHDPTKALECLGRIAVDSPRRGDAELTAGQALWNAYLEALRLPEERQPTKAEMTRLISEGRKLLQSGVARLRKPVDDGANASYSLAAASLALAQICLQMGDGAKAVAWLDDPKLGAHTLAKAGDKTIDRGNFRVETFKTALRAYVATQRIEKAEKVMNALEKAGGSAHAAKVYTGLGRQLEQSMKQLRAEGNEAEATKVAWGFGLFLARIADRPATQSDYATLYWVAETFMNLGDSLSPGDERPSPEAMKNYEKATAAFEKIVETCQSDPKFAPQPGSLTTVRLGLARCLRRLGKFKEAMDALVEILKVHENRLDVQREAAYTYQAWGEEKPGYFMLAIRGGRKVVRKDGSPAHLVWGWGGIALRIQHIEAHRDLFNEARYNLAMCRLKYAQSKTGQEQVDELRQAEQDILVVQRLYPEMGGKKWYDRYDALLRTIQKLLGVKDDRQGLKAAEQRLSPASK